VGKLVSKSCKETLHNAHFTGDDKPEPRDTNSSIVPNFSAADKWRKLGEALQIPSSHLDIIDTDHPNSCEARCRAMLRKWAELDPSASWGKLIDAANIVQPVFGTLSTATEGAAEGKCVV